MQVYGCYTMAVIYLGYKLNQDIHVHYLQLDTLGHYTVYALEGRGGDVRWHLTPKDFHFNPAFNPVRILTPIMIQWNL